MSNVEDSEVAAVSDKAASPEVPLEEQVKTEPTEENSTSEAKAQETEKSEEKQIDKFAPKFAALSRKEKELRQREREMSERLAQKEAEIKEKLQQIEEFEARKAEREKLKKEKPVKFLEEEGLTYEQITQAILNNGELSKEQKVEQLLSAQQEQIKALQQKLEERDRKEQEEREQAERAQLEKQYQERIVAFKSDISSFLSEKTDDYELLMNNPFDEDPTEAVYETVASWYQEHGEILDIKDAADMVERFLEERAERLARTKKISQKLPPQQSKEEVEKQDPAQSNSPKTLENAHSSTTPNRQARKLTEDELIAEAAKHVRFN